MENSRCQSVCLALSADAYEPFPDDQPRGPDPFELLGAAEGVPTLVPSGVCASTLEPSKKKQFNRLSKRNHRKAQTFCNRQRDCLIRGPMIRVNLVVKYLSISHLSWTPVVVIGEVRTSASISSSVKSAVNSALSPKLSSPTADGGGSVLELRGGSGGLDGPASSTGGSVADSPAAAAFFALSLWLRLRSTVVEGPADVLASSCSGGLVELEERPPDATPASAASIPLRRDPLNIRPETRGLR